jgi:hypothetical protein
LRKSARRMSGARAIPINACAGGDGFRRGATYLRRPCPRARAIRRLATNGSYAASDGLNASQFLPDGQITACRANQCPAPFAKIFRFTRRANQNYKHRHPVPRRGASAIVTNVGAGCGGRGSVRRARGSQGGSLRERPTGAQTTGAEAYGKTVWSWHPLLVSSRRRFCRPDRALQNRQFADDGDKTNSSPGRARHKP